MKPKPATDPVNPERALTRARIDELIPLLDSNNAAVIVATCNALINYLDYLRNHNSNLILAVVAEEQKNGTHRRQSPGA